MTDNPFYYNLPAQPEDFVGRWPLVDEIVKDLAGGRADSWAVIGGRRFGKSSVLKALEYRLQARLKALAHGERFVFPVLIDLKGIETDTEQKVFARIIQLLRRALLRSSTIPGPQEFKGMAPPESLSYYQFEEELEQILRTLEQTAGSARVALFLDEVESIVRHPWAETLLNQLRALIYDGPLANSVKIVLTGSAQVVRVRHLGSPLLNALKVVHLENLDPGSLDKLLNRGGIISEQGARAVREYSEGHPFIAQYLLHHLWTDGLEMLKPAQVELAAGQLRETRSADFAGWWQAVGPAGQQAYRVLVKAGDWVGEREILASLDPGSYPDQGLSALCYHGLVNHDRVSRQYRVAGKAFQEWYQVNTGEPMSQPQNGINKLTVFLSHASQDKPKVRKLCKRLRDDGFDPWLDEERLVPGQEWSLEIQKAMRESHAILLCFSELSVAKEGYVQREYKKAMDLQLEKPEGTIFVIPVRLDDCEIPYSIRELQHVDYPVGYARLAKALNLRAEKVNAAKATQVPEKKTKPAPAVRPAGKVPSGPVFKIKDGIHAGQDVVQGNQINYVTITNITNIQSPAEFVTALEQVLVQVAEMKKSPLTPVQARNMDVVETCVMAAVEEAQKPQPLGERVKSTLSEAKETLDLLSSSLGTAATLGTTLGGLVMMTVKIFGG